MFNLRRVLERQQREDEEIRRRRAEKDRELDEEEEEVVLWVCLINQGNATIVVPQTWTNIGTIGGDIECNPICSKKIMHDVCNYDTYFVQKYDALGVLGILPEQKLTTALRMP
ncbi:unnamed protein product [Prunus armeniaca]